MPEGDWFDNLSDEDRAQWDEYVAHVRKETLVKMTGSEAVISMAPQGEPDVKFCVELGMAIMLDKPVVVLAWPGQKLPRHLMRVADEIVRADIDTDEGQRDAARKMHDAVERVTSRRPGSGGRNKRRGPRTP